MAALLLAGYFLWSTHEVGTVFVLVLFYTIAQSLLTSTDVAFRPAEQGRSWAIRRVVYETSAFLLVLAALAVFGVKSANTLLALSTIAVFVAVIWGGAYRGAAHGADVVPSSSPPAASRSTARRSAPCGPSR